MDKTRARNLVRDTFQQGFNRARYEAFLRDLLNRFEEKPLRYQGAYIPDAFKDQVSSLERIGTYQAPGGERIDLLIVQLTKHSTLARARTALRNYIAHHLKTRDAKDAALVAFVSPAESTWRFSYVRMEYATVTDARGRVGIKTELTPARRLSYLVGAGESCHTAQSRFLDILQGTTHDPTIEEIEAAFSVEAVTREFFEQYQTLFLNLKEQLDALAARDKVVGREFSTRKIDTVDFAKKLMGQIVFLYFLQKKGWLGVAKGQAWGAGPHDFIRRLSNGDFGVSGNIFNDILEPLFYDTLATDRGEEAWCSRFNCRIPFLNGGLFEPIRGYDWSATDITIPNAYFTNEEMTPAGDRGTGILDVFDRYNFTVNEAEPLEIEVAIDPEMLGKVFENLLEVRERKSKGSFYTPREIVHYMCEASLINYLDHRLNRSSRVVDRTDIEALIRGGEQAAHYEAARKDGTVSYVRRLSSTVEKHAQAIDDALSAITVCDPAIGSGAFPVGMMTEIVRARTTLTPYFPDTSERTPYHFKRHAIQASLYGVDIDPGAIEIAKLRLWLSLVVDEEDVQHIKPLPNLDYKVVVGNSLLGFPFKSLRVQRIEQLKTEFFDETDHDKKTRLKLEIDSELAQAFASSRRTLGYEVSFDFATYFSEVFSKNDGFDVLIGNPPYVFGGNKGISKEEKDAYKRQYVSGANKINLFTLFIERGSQLLRRGGALLYILPNTLLRVTSYSNTRQFILENLTVNEVVDLDVGVFDKVTASTIIISLVNEKPSLDWHATVKRGCKDVESTHVLQAEWTRRGYIFDIFSSIGDRGVFEKLARDSTLLEDLCYRIRFGVVISGNLEEVVGDRQKTQAWKPFLEGHEIGPFYTKYGGRFLHYDHALLHRSRTPDVFETRKIMIQRITGGETPLKATLDENGFYNKESILNLILERDDISYEYVLGLLNSTLVNWFYKRRFTNGSKLTVNISKEYVGQIPVRLPSQATQEAVTNVVRRILAAKQHDADADVHMLERELNKLVYALYDLTAAEIALVEEGVK